MAGVTSARDGVFESCGAVVVMPRIAVLMLVARSCLEP